MLRNIEQLITKAIKENKEVEDYTHKELTLYIWNMQGAKIPEDVKRFIIAHCVSPEAIARGRRQLVNQFPYSRRREEETMFATECYKREARRE